MNLLSHNLTHMYVGAWDCAGWFLYKFDVILTVHLP